MKRIVWTEPAKADVRALDKPTALRILSALDRFAESGAGDVKALQGEREELRLRIGDYRLFFVSHHGGHDRDSPRPPSGGSLQIKLSQ